MGGLGYQAFNLLDSSGYLDEKSIVQTLVSGDCELGDGDKSNSDTRAKAVLS